MKFKVILFAVLVFSILTHAADNTFFGVTLSSTLAEFKTKNSKTIEGCKDLGKFSSLRLNSEVTGQYEQDESETNVAQVECKMGNQITATFVKVGSEFYLWRIDKYDLDKSVAKVVSELEAKTGTSIKVESEAVNENLGIMYSFKVKFVDGEIRGYAVEPYSKKVTQETLSMKNSGLKLVLPSPLRQIIESKNKQEKQAEKHQKEKINSGDAGI